MTDRHDDPRTTAAMCHAIDDAGVGREVAVAQEGAIVAVTQSDRDAVQAFHRTMLDRLMSDVKSQRPKLGDDEGDAGTLVQAFARHRLAATSLHDMQGTAALASPCISGEGVGISIPADIAEHVLSLGRVEWGQTPAHDAEGHGQHVATSVRLTAEHFEQHGDQHMHGLWLAGTETVLCHTGTSPNAPKTTQALVGAWNWLVDQASGVPTPDATQTREAEGVQLIVVTDTKGFITLHEPDEDGSPGDLVASVWRDDWLDRLAPLTGAA